MDDQLPDDIEIGYSALRMLRLVGLGAIMTLLSASIAFNWFAYENIDSFHVLMAYVGIAFCGLATLKFIWTLITASGAVVVISRYGIRDLRVSNELILWGSVEDVTPCEFRRQKFMALKINPALEKQLFATKAKQAMLLANRALGVDGVVIGASGLTMDIDTLLKTCTAYYSAVKSSRVVRPQANRSCDGRQETVANDLSRSFAASDGSATSRGR
jgi:hypothetical protein